MKQFREIAVAPLMLPWAVAMLRFAAGMARNVDLGVIIARVISFIRRRRSKHGCVGQIERVAGASTFPCTKGRISFDALQNQRPWLLTSAAQYKDCQRDHSRGVRPGGGLETEKQPEPRSLCLCRCIRYE